MIKYVVHAWTIQTSEPLFLLGTMLKDKNLLIDSWYGFITNFSKTDDRGNSYACYLPDYFCGGGDEETRASLLTIPKEMVKKSFKITHGYPTITDRSLFRYVWVRAFDTWMRTAAVLDINEETVFIICHIKNSILIFDTHIEEIYSDTILDIKSSLCRDNVKIIDMKL